MWMYALSIILPSICYLAIGQWNGMKYLRSKNKKENEIGIIALILIIASSFVTFYLSYFWITSYIQNFMSSLGGGLNGF